MWRRFGCRHWVVLAAALMLAACGGASSGDSGSTNGGNSSGGSTPVAGDGPGSSTTYTQTFMNRSVTYIVPDPVSTAAAPMLVLLPYQTGTGSTMETLTRADRLASQYGAWVVLPGTAPLAIKWNDDPSADTGVDDVGFLAALISDVEANNNIDPTRVYMGGYSNSGFMSARFACEHSDLVSGIALIATTQKPGIESECGSIRPIRTVFFMGTNDAVTPYNGVSILGTTTIYSAQAAEQLWETHDGCSAAGRSQSDLPPSMNDGTTVSLTSNSSCSGNSAVALYTINGGGHTWPGNQLSPTTALIDGLYLGTTSQNIDATLVLWQFFTGQ